MKSKSKPLSKHHSHLTFEDRVRIDEMLRCGNSFRYIASALKKTASTISREVHNHATVIPSRRNDCINLKNCKKTNICGKEGCSRKFCKSCNVPCRKHCTDYAKSHCERLAVSPYVCNGCHKYNICSYERRIYIPKDAEKEYRSTLVNRRNGFDLTGEQLIAIDEMVSPLIRQGQSPYHVKQTLGSSLPVSESTLRRMIHNSELDTRDIDLRSVVSRKPRRKGNHSLHNETLSQLKLGHTYKDYLNYVNEHDVTAVQMDCVEGKKDDNAVLLTLHFPLFHMNLHTL